MNPTPEDAVVAFQWVMHADAAKRHAIGDDRIVQFLNAEIRHTSHTITEGEEAGFVQLVANLDSPASYRRRRAAALLHVRRAVLWSGKSETRRDALTLCAKWRAQEYATRMARAHARMAEVA